MGGLIGLFLRVVFELLARAACLAEDLTIFAFWSGFIDAKGAKLIRALALSQAGDRPGAGLNPYSLDA